MVPRGWPVSTIRASATTSENATPTDGTRSHASRRPRDPAGTPKANSPNSAAAVAALAAIR